MSRQIEPYLSPAAEQAEQDAAHADIRAQVRDDAAADRHSRIHPDDVRAAFEGHEEELRECGRLREETRARRAALAAKRDDASLLQAETQRVLAEQDENRRCEAEAEARRRLGLPEDAEGGA